MVSSFTSAAAVPQNFLQMQSNLLDSFADSFPTISRSLLAHPGETCQYCTAVRDCCICTYGGVYWNRSKAALANVRGANLNCEQIQQECWLETRQPQTSSQPPSEAEFLEHLEKQRQAVTTLAPFVTTVKLAAEDSRFLQDFATLANLSKLGLTLPQTTAKIQQAKQALLLLPELRSLSLYDESQQSRPFRLLLLPTSAACTQGTPAAAADPFSKYYAIEV